MIESKHTKNLNTQDFLKNSNNKSRIPVKLPEAETKKRGRSNRSYRYWHRKPVSRPPYLALGESSSPKQGNGL